jgi:outer membrane protein OmpA-like peptidoglycan-associated protein
VDKQEADRLRALAQKYQDKAERLGLDQDAEAWGDLLGELDLLHKKYPYVKPDKETGEILIDDQILFQSNSAELSEKGKSVLREVIPEWAEIVTRPKYERIIKEVVFEGHADTRGDRDPNRNYLANLELTMRRSEAVARFVFQPDWPFPHQEELRDLVSSSGRSNVVARRQLSEELLKKNPGLTRQQIWQRAWNADSSKSRRVGLRLSLQNPLYRWRRGGEAGR